MFEKILRDLERLAEEFAGQPPTNTPSDIRGELKTMHFDGLKRASARATQLGYFKFERSIDQIRVGDSLTGLFEKLVENTRNDGKERGRILRIDLGGTKVYVDPTTVGDEDSVTQSFRTTIYHEQKPYQAFSLIHTHPVSYPHGHRTGMGGRRLYDESKRAAEHLSKQDFLSLLCHPTPASMVLCEGNWLWVLKTRETPSASACVQNRDLERRLNGMLEAALHHPNVQRLGDSNRIFAKLVCIELGLELFIAQPTDRTLFKKVLLTPTIHS